MEFTVFVKFEGRTLRLTMSRKCTLKSLVKYAQNKFKIDSYNLQAFDKDQKELTSSVFAEKLDDPSRNYLVVKLKRIVVKERSQKEFKGYLKLLNERSKKAAGKYTTLFRQNCFTERSSPSPRKSPVKYVGLFRQNCFVQATSDLGKPLSKYSPSRVNKLRLKRRFRI